MINRDGQQLSASQAWQQALSDADHLGALHSAWAAESALAREQRYRQLLAVQLPPGRQPEHSHRGQWLWRTLHAAELAGNDAGQLLVQALSERDLIGVRDVAAVIDSRIRRREGSRVPVPRGSWSQQVPEFPDDEHRAYLAQLARLMDERKVRLGVHAAAKELLWATSALGPVPDDHAARAEWEHRAASIGAYRELSGYSHPSDPIGPEPAAATPDLRTAWHEALSVLGW